MKLKDILWKFFREQGEEITKDKVADLVAEVNEEGQQWIAEVGEPKLDELLADVPAELAEQIKPAIIALVVEAVEAPLQKALDRAWAEVEKINPADAPDPSPVVDLDGE
jgi:hypothetical protein